MPLWILAKLQPLIEGLLADYEVVGLVAKEGFFDQRLEVEGWRVEHPCRC